MKSYFLSGGHEEEKAMVLLIIRKNRKHYYPKMLKHELRDGIRQREKRKQSFSEFASNML